MSRGQDCGSSTNDTVLIDDMNSSCGTLKDGPLSKDSYGGKPSSIQTCKSLPFELFKSKGLSICVTAATLILILCVDRVNKQGGKREVLYSSFQ